MNLLCVVGLHDWQEYRSGFVGGLDLVIRSWCPRCKADSILFGAYREVSRNAWTDKTPAEQDAEFQAMRERVYRLYAEKVVASESEKP